MEDNTNVAPVNSCNAPTEPGEEWRLIEDTRIVQQRYYVSNLGNVWDNAKSRMLTLCHCHDGYLIVHLAVASYREVQVSVHRLVALAFIPNPDQKPQVDHIDGNKHNNAVSNLRWVDRKTNVNNGATRPTHVTSVKRGSRKNMRPVICIETGQRFESAIEAAAIMGISCSSISSSCKTAHRTKAFIRKQKGGKTVYHYRYADDCSIPAVLPLETVIPVSGGIQPNAKPVRCIESGVVYPSAKVAGKAHHIAYNNIIAACKATARGKGPVISARGTQRIYHFAYATREEFERFYDTYLKARQNTIES